MVLFLAVNLLNALHSSTKLAALCDSIEYLLLVRWISVTLAVINSLPQQ